MAQQRPFRFGAVVDNAESREDWKKQVRKIEDAGYSSVLVPDHFEMVNISPTIALMAAADISTTLRIGSFVFNNDLRHPAMLAKEIATLDLFSEGRVEMGLGSGYLPDDYTKSGIPLDPAGTRISRMEEAIHLLKALFSAEPATFSGKYYQVNGLPGLPKPLQKPHPPLYIGGGGRRMLSIAAREADIVGLTAILKPGGTGFVMGDITASATEQKVEWIRQAAGERFEHLEINSFVFAAKVTDHREMVAGHIAHGAGLAPEDILNSPHFLIGSVEQICEDLYHYRERYGISYLSLLGGGSNDEFTPVIARMSGK
jgi:probable F420-dependent oxidoreductase